MVVLQISLRLRTQLLDSLFLTSHHIAEVVSVLEQHHQLVNKPTSRTPWPHNNAPEKSTRKTARRFRTRVRDMNTSTNTVAGPKRTTALGNRTHLSSNGMNKQEQRNRNGETDKFSVPLTTGSRLCEESVYITFSALLHEHNEALWPKISPITDFITRPIL